jgi:hypothetical protein
MSLTSSNSRFEQISNELAKSLAYAWTEIGDLKDHIVLLEQELRVYKLAEEQAKENPLHLEHEGHVL